MSYSAIVRCKMNKINTEKCKYSQLLNNHIKWGELQNNLSLSFLGSWVVGQSESTSTPKASRYSSSKNLIFEVVLYVFTNLYAWAGCNTKSIFKVEFNRFEFRVFLSPRLVNIARLESYSMGVNCWIHIKAMWKANSLIQDLNSSCHVHFQLQYP